MNDAALADQGHLGTEETAERLAQVERRVENLETTVAKLEDTAGLEERIVERVASRITLVAGNDAEKVKAGPPPAETHRGLSPAPAPPEITGQRWLLVEAFDEVRTILAMLLDRQYRMGWLAFIYMVVFLGLILTSTWWCPVSWIPWAGTPYLDKLVDLVLALFLYMALGREARRYRRERQGK